MFEHIHKQTFPICNETENTMYTFFFRSQSDRYNSIIVLKVKIVYRPRLPPLVMQTAASNSKELIDLKHKLI